MSAISKSIKDDSLLLSRPRVTEKATFVAGAKYPVYSFEVADGATKPTVARAIETKYKVKPVKVNMIKLPRKAVVVRGRKGWKPCVKKALVFLKPGDKIELV